MSDVFVSYANEDRLSAERLANCLAGAGFSVWWDRKIPPGRSWDDTIGRALGEAKCIIVLWSERSVASRWVREEAEIAAQRGVLIPVLIEEVSPPVGFRRIEAARLVGWTGDSADPEFRQLVESVAQLVPRTGDFKPPEQLRDTSRMRSIVGRLHSLPVWFRWVSALTAGFALVYVVFVGIREWKPTIVPSDSRGTIRVWKVGSPHEGDTPDTTVPLTLTREASDIGAHLTVEAFPAQGFAARFFDALTRNDPPDLLVIDNYGIIEGITTKLGNFVGIGRDPTVSKSLLQVHQSFEGLLGGSGGWTFLITGSRNHDMARMLALRSPSCGELTSEESAGELRSLLPTMAAAYLEARRTDLDGYADPDRLSLAEAGKPVRVGSMNVCGVWGNDRLVFASVVASFVEPRSIGYAPVLLVLRKNASGWKLLAAARDPISTDEFLKGVPDFAKRLENGGGRPDSSVAAARLLAPPDGQSPSAAAGERFGNFVWQASTSPEVVGQIAEFAYQDDARLFLINSGGSVPTNVISSGLLWSTRSTWRWRIWSIANTGNVAFSESRSFPN